MSSMTQKANSDCSYPEFDYEDVKSQISRVHERLTAMLQEEMELRQSLEELFDKQEVEALKELRKAEQNLKSIREERQAMRIQLKDKRFPTGAVQDPVEEIEAPATPLERNPASAALIGDQQPTSDQEQNSPLPIEDPEAQALSVKYGGNKTALELETRMRNHELQAEEYKMKMDEFEPIARRWAEIKRKYSRQSDHWSLASTEYYVANKKMSDNKSAMEQAEKNAAIIRDILTHFEVPQED